MLERPRAAARRKEFRRFTAPMGSVVRRGQKRANLRKTSKSCQHPGFRKDVDTWGMKNPQALRRKPVETRYLKGKYSRRGRLCHRCIGGRKVGLEGKVDYPNSRGN